MHTTHTPRRAMAALPALACLALAAAAWTPQCVRAAPLDLKGKPVQPEKSASSADTPQGREYRAGLQALLKGDWPESRARFEAALKLDPEGAPPLVGLASVAQAQGDAKAAEQYLQRAEKSAPNSAEVHLAWGRFHASQRHAELAERSFRKAQTLSPGKAPPLVELGGFYMQTGKSAEAQKAYREALAINPKNAVALFGLGVASAALGQRAEALHAFVAAAAAAPKDPEAPRAAGRLHLEARAYDKALGAFDEGLARRPGYLPLMLDRVDALVGLKRPADAIAQAQAIEKLAPKSAEAQIKLADTYQAAGRWNEAQAGYLKTIELAPGNPLAYNNLAWMTLERKGDAAQAVGWAKKAVELSPNSSPLYDTLGWAERAAGNLPGAASSLSKAIQLESDVAGYHFHLGVVQGEMKQSAAAKASLQKALQLDKQLPQADEARRLLRALPAA